MMLANAATGEPADAGRAIVSGASARVESARSNHEAIVGAICVMRTVPRLPVAGTPGPAMISDERSSACAGSKP